MFHSLCLYFFPILDIFQSNEDGIGNPITTEVTTGSSSGGNAGNSNGNDNGNGGLENGSPDLGGNNSNDVHWH